MTESIQTGCAVVGGGPAGAILSLMLARSGVEVTLLEAHHDFDRDFRGDTLHVSVLDILDELGLADRLLELPHAKMSTLTVHFPDGPLAMADFSRLKSRHPYVVILPQARFIEFIVAEARRCPSFRLIMGARADELIEEDGRVAGVRCKGKEGQGEIRAPLTVGTDGRFSTLRRLSGLEAITTSPSIDVLWFRLPRAPGDLQSAGQAYFGPGHILILLERPKEWQIAYLIPKGSYQQLRAGGLDALRQSVAEAAPFFADRVSHLHDWKQVQLLSVASDRLRRWYRPGLLLIGDAAHVMSPVAGLGINYAIQDAVAAANVLTAPLRAGRVELADLAAVQRQREWPTRVAQAIQSATQRQVVDEFLVGGRLPRRTALALSLIGRVPLLRDVPARLMGIGVRRVHVRERTGSTVVVGRSLPIVTPRRAIQIGLIVAPSLFASSAYLTRANARRVAGGLAAALAYGAANFALDQVAFRRRWWSYPGWGPDGRFPLGMYGMAGLVAGGATTLIGWRVTRRYGRRGLLAFAAGWTAWGAFHDLAGSRAFADSELMVIEPGVLPALADVALYASCWSLAYLAMRLVAGPAREEL